MRGSRRAVCGGLLLALVVSFATAPAVADYGSDPIGPAWVPDGPVLAVATAGSRVFVGGGFTGGVAALDASTGALLWSGAANGDVRALAVSSDGTHLIAGGLFSRVGGARHANLASLRVGDGAPEPGWTADAAGRVRDIVVDGDVAYFGGTFTQHDGLDQRGLGAVRVSTGEVVAAFDATTDGNVYALATNGSRLFVGGSYTQVDGQPRDSLASVDLTSNALDPWRPTRPCTGCNVQWDIVVNGSTVYVSGRNAGAVTAFDATSAARRWRVPANGDAQALTLADGTLYAGGHFVEIGNDELRVPRTQLAALDPATGAIDPDFRPRFVDSYPGIWALAATSTRLFAGGYFSAAGASPPRQHPYFAMFGGVAANAAPTAQATASPSPALVDQDITLSASGSDDVETPDALTFAWDLGNGGSTNDATGEVVHHAYPQAGRYTATVTVTDAGGARDTASVVVVVNDPPNAPPTARATADPAETLPGEEVTLSASGSGDAEDPDDLDFAWDLGDGENATGEVVRHAYQQAGHYTVTVTVTDPDGDTDTATSVVQVDEVVPCPAAQVNLGSGWRTLTSDRAWDGNYCASDGPHGGRDVVTLSFRGPWVTVMHGDALRGGTARVFVDGDRQANLSFRSGTRRTEFGQQRKYAGLGAGRHTLRLEVVRKTGFLEGFVLP